MTREEREAVRRAAEARLEGMPERCDDYDVGFWDGVDVALDLLAEAQP